MPVAPIAVLLLAAAPEPPLPEADGPPPPALFVSPAGEPFRSEPGAPYPSAAWFAGADRDHDGALTSAEFKADADRFFGVLDADGDGRIDGLEVSRYEDEIFPEILPRAAHRMDGPPGGFGPAMRGPRGGFPGGGPGRRGGKRDGADLLAASALQGASRYGFFDEPQPVRAADLNLDFRVTRDEFARAAEKRFARLDTDHDGRLRSTELPTTPIQARPANGPPRKRSAPAGLRFRASPEHLAAWADSKAPTPTSPPTT